MIYAGTTGGGHIHDEARFVHLVFLRDSTYRVGINWAWQLGAGKWAKCSVCFAFRFYVFLNDILILPY